MTADSIVKDVREAIDMFGRYTFEDKGAGEVMDVAAIVRYVRGLDAEAARDLLVAVATQPVERDLCVRLVEAVMSDLQDVPDEFWEVLIAHPVLEKAAM